MPDHVHVVLTPLSDDNGPISIPEIMQAIKSESAHTINKVLGQRGHVWQDESFDHVLRRETSIDRAIEYLMENAISLGIENPSDYPWFWRAQPEGHCRLSAGEVARAHNGI